MNTTDRDEAFRAALSDEQKFATVCLTVFNVAVGINSGKMDLIRGCAEIMEMAMLLWPNPNDMSEALDPYIDEIILAFLK